MILVNGTVRAYYHGETIMRLVDRLAALAGATARCYVRREGRCISILCVALPTNDAPSLRLMCGELETYCSMPLQVFDNAVTPPRFDSLLDKRTLAEVL